MAVPAFHGKPLWIAVLGWTLQTVCLLLFLPAVNLSTPGWWTNAGALVGSTILLGWGIAGIAAARGHSRAFAVLASVNLAGLIMAGLLPPLVDDDHTLAFECPHCGLTSQVDLEHAGRSGPCRGCGQPIRVPGLLSSSDLTGEHDSTGEHHNVAPMVGEQSDASESESAGRESD